MLKMLGSIFSSAMTDSTSSSSRSSPTDSCFSMELAAGGRLHQSVAKESGKKVRITLAENSNAALSGGTRHPRASDASTMSEFQMLGLRAI